MQRGKARGSHGKVEGIYAKGKGNVKQWKSRGKLCHRGKARGSNGKVEENYATGGSKGKQ